MAIRLDSNNMNTYISRHMSFIGQIRKAKGSDTAMSEKTEITYLLKGLPQSMQSWAFIKNAKQGYRSVTSSTTSEQTPNLKLPPQEVKRNQDKSSFYGKEKP